MDTNKMLIRHGLQVAPLALAGGGGPLGSHTTSPCVPPRALLGWWRGSFSQHAAGTRPSHWFVFVFTAFIL